MSWTNFLVSSSFYWEGKKADMSYYSKYPLFQSPHHAQVNWWQHAGHWNSTCSAALPCHGVPIVRVGHQAQTGRGLWHRRHRDQVRRHKDTETQRQTQRHRHRHRDQVRHRDTETQRNTEIRWDSKNKFCNWSWGKFSTTDSCYRTTKTCCINYGYWFAKLLLISYTLHYWASIFSAPQCEWDSSKHGIGESKNQNP